MITFNRGHVALAFPEVHADAHVAVTFLRTLRVPDDGVTYPLPPGLGEFPLKPTLGSRAPDAWQNPSAVMMPLWPSEAMWIDFPSRSYPCAIKIGTGGANALTGAEFSDNLNLEQDYVVLPDQPWIDGYVIDQGIVRQFIATALGGGRSVAEQMACSASQIGLRLTFFPMTAWRYELFREDRARAKGLSKPLALGGGGLIRQEVYLDTYGIDAWVAEPAATIGVYLVPARAWRSLTGNRAPARPPAAEDYTDAGLPWFDYYDPAGTALPARVALANIRSAKPPRKSRMAGVSVAQVKQIGKGSRP